MVLMRLGSTSRLGTHLRRSKHCLLHEVMCSTKPIGYEPHARRQTATCIQARFLFHTSRNSTFLGAVAKPSLFMRLEIKSPNKRYIVAHSLARITQSSKAENKSILVTGANTAKDQRNNPIQTKQVQ